MNEFKVYYHVVPTDDGYTYLCQDKNTSEFYLHKKILGQNPEALVFSSEQAAEEWIELAKLPKGRFKAEEFGTVYAPEKLSDETLNDNNEPQPSYAELEHDPTYNVYMLG